ncbi:AraC family transcriptional regulator [Streptomyces genisteinicus]|uniref:AraC family transcriptional regulator n=1 Tax=Streptomyces genisteinicus TaxID=2768068 RepID=A0A7H0I4G6_9ACTN|nr:AraC family transcriptional regulator [Streptomyces genisteinicus]
METLAFQSNRLDVTEDFLSRAYTPMRIGGRPQKTGARIERASAGGLLVDKVDFDYTLSYDAGALDKVCLITLHRGLIVDTTGGGRTAHGPGETFLVALPDRPYTGEERGARYTITMFDAALLDQVAGGDERRDGPVRFTGRTPVDEEAGRRLGRTVAFLRDTVLGGPAPAAEGLVVSTALRHLAAVALTSLPGTLTAHRPRPVDGRDAGTATLRRAMTFIEENAHRDIGLSDIAAAVRVTPRAVQYAFRRHASTTPLGHLRRVRLAHAHGDLRAATTEVSSVLDIAARWGFAHPGRFAAAYRDAYGASPSDTLRAAP